MWRSVAAGTWQQEAVAAGTWQREAVLVGRGLQAGPAWKPVPREGPERAGARPRCVRGPCRSPGSLDKQRKGVASVGQSPGQALACHCDLRPPGAPRCRGEGSGGGCRGGPRVRQRALSPGVQGPCPFHGRGPTAWPQHSPDSSWVLALPGRVLPQPSCPFSLL